MSVKTMQTSDDIAREASKRRAKLEAEQVELDQLEAEAQKAADREQAARDAAADDWWTARRAGFHDRVQGRVDQAWQAFVVAVRDNGDSVASWKAYRLAVRAVADDKASIDAYFHARARAAVQTQRAHFNRAAHEGMTLDALSKMIGRDISRAEYDARLAAWRQDTDAYRSAYAGGDPVTDDEVAAALAQGFLERLVTPLPPPEYYKLGSAAAEQDANNAGRRGYTSYSEAVDQVVADLEQEAVAAARAARDSEREQYVEAKVTAAR